MKPALPALIFLFIISCTGKQKDTAKDINRLAEQYLEIGLSIGQYDSDFVDAYYGPDSLKHTVTPGSMFPKDSLLNAIASLQESLKKITATSAGKENENRAAWLSAQFTAFTRRIKIFSGENAAFDAEAQELFGVKPPEYEEQHFKDIIQLLDKSLPGTGSIEERIKALSAKFIIPADKIDTVFRIAIAEARRRTMNKYKLPAGESFTLTYVHDKPWSGYNWYKGNYKSEIQINIDLPIYIERAIDLACHEGYPGHHVYNMLLEKNLYRDKGFAEISMYPLFSPQSLIAEGSANYGIQLAFPGTEQRDYCKNVLLPAAGMDTTGIAAYFYANDLKGKLSYAKNEAARGLLNGKLTESAAKQWLISYALYSEKGADNYLKFIKKYRSYVINYNYGMDLIKDYIEADSGSDPDKRWNAFASLLSNEVLTADLK